MKATNISYLKNHTSQVLRMVKEGESVTIMDRRHPVATLQPITRTEGDAAGHLAQLVREGAARAPSTPLKLAQWRRRPWPDWQGGAPLTEHLDDDRGGRP